MTSRGFALNFTALRITAFLLLITAVSACAGQKTVWQIGQFDNNYEEFAIPHNFGAYSQAFPRGVTFHPGVDDPAKSWPFIQPGPSDSWAGSRAHSNSIVFNLDSQPTGVYTLTVDFADTHYGGPPVYEVSVNGRSGRFRLPAGGSDESLTDASKGKEYVLNLSLPASYFQAGENKIVLKSVDGAWALYDALSLTNDPSASMGASEVRQVSLSPTILFARDGNKIKQVAKLFVQATPGTTACTAAVKVGGSTQDLTLTPDLMGTVAQDILIDEVTAPTTAEITVAAGGNSKTASCELKPQKHWKIYLQASTHVDIGYTDHQDRIAERHNDNMTAALELCKKYPEFKWNTEAAWVEDNYLTMMPADKKADFIKLAKEGRIGCEAIYGNMLTGLCSHESFIRDLYFAHDMAAKYGIPYDIAMSSDVPTQVWTLPTILANAGIKYYSAGLNLDRGYTFNRMFDKSPFYWQGPDGSKVLAWFAAGYGYASHLGLDSTLAQAADRISGFLKGFDRADYPYDAVLGFGGFGDNQPMHQTFAPVIDEWNKTYAYPQVIMCRGPEFFQYIESNFKDKIATISGDGGVYWEDGAGSSATETAMNRQAKERLVTAEKLFSLAGGKYPKAEIDLAWKNAILYDEHTWGAAQSISNPQHEQTIAQWQVKSRFAQDAETQASDLMNKGMARLAGTVKAAKNSVIVFNSLSWPVSDWATIPTSGDGDITYVENIPPLGYKVVAMPGKPSAEREIKLGSGAPVLENKYYRIEFDRVTGGIRSLYDKELKRELVDPKSSYCLNQYIYTTGRRNGPRVADFKDVTREGVTVPVQFEARRYAPGAVMNIKGSANNAPAWATMVALYDNAKRIDFINGLTKTETTDKEAGYFAFPFALDKPEWYVELPDGVVKPKQNMLPGADMEWYCTQDFVAAADDRSAVVWTAWDSPLVTLGDINREQFRSPVPFENGHLYAYAFNNCWHTNYKASQGGKMFFRFSLTSMPKYDPVAAARFGQAARNNLIAMAVQPNSKGRSTASTGSLCFVDKPNVVIQTVKQAESGTGTIIRLREVAGRATQATVTLPAGKFKKAWSCTLVEDPKSKLSIVGGKVKVPVAAGGLATVMVSEK